MKGLSPELTGTHSKRLCGGVATRMRPSRLILSEEGDWAE
jgi:hypothetical protein